MDRLEDVGQTYTAAIQRFGFMPGRKESETTNCGSWPWTHYYFGTKGISPDVAYLHMAPAVKPYRFLQADELLLWLSSCVPVPSSAAGQHGREKMARIFTPEFKLISWH